MLKIITDLLTGAALLDELDHDLLGVIARILGQSLGDHQKSVSIGLHKQKRNFFSTQDKNGSLKQYRLQNLMYLFSIYA